MKNDKKKISELAKLYKSKRIEGLPENYPRPGYYMIYGTFQTVNVLRFIGSDKDNVILPKLVASMWKPEEKDDYSDEIELDLLPIIQNGNYASDAVFEREGFSVIEIHVKRVEPLLVGASSENFTTEIEWEFTPCPSKYKSGFPVWIS